MGGIKYNLDILDEARTQMAKHSTTVGTVADDVGGLSVSASDFGDTNESVSLAHAITTLISDAKTQCSKGESLLKSVSTAIDRVQSAIEDADRSGKQNFEAGESHVGGAVNGPAGGGGGTTPESSGGGGGGGGTNAALHSGMAPPVDPGTGVKVNLPGGMGTVEAPNEKAAGAVRSAISQLGVPYVFGADSPGSGFDCSGLTKWAYGKEGLSLPHDAASQDVGQRVSEQNLAPGDLVVWDGHVAMFIGKGKVIEAPQTGEDVHIVPLYTHNGSDRFEGFFRPTAK